MCCGIGGRTGTMMRKNRISLKTINFNYVLNETKYCCFMRCAVVEPSRGYAYLLIFLARVRFVDKVLSMPSGKVQASIIAEVNFIF